MKKTFFYNNFLAFLSSFHCFYQRKHKWLSSFEKGLSFNVTWIKWIINIAEHVFLSLLCYFSSFEKIKYQKKMQLQEIDL